MRKNYDLIRLIVNVEESLTHPEPFAIQWKIQGKTEFDLAASLNDEFKSKKIALKQKFAQDMLELFKEMEQKDLEQLNLDLPKE